MTELEVETSVRFGFGHNYSQGYPIVLFFAFKFRGVRPGNATLACVRRSVCVLLFLSHTQ